MRRKRNYKKTSPRERILGNIISYSIMMVIIITISLILNVLYKSNNIIIKGVKSNISKIIADTKKVKPNTPTIPKKIVFKNITRSEAYKRGMDIINYVWVYNSKINGIKSNENIALPNYLIGVNEVKISGLPYCWGGYTSLDISNQPDVKNFKEAIKKGYTAGNIYCSGNYKNFTAGLDCSGFVCAVFKIPEKCSTDNLNNYFDLINIKDLKPMDILNSKNKHVFIYLGETKDKKGVITLEASYNKFSQNSEKTIVNYRSWDSIQKGMDGIPFIAMRYKGIIDTAVNTFQDVNEYNLGREYTVEIKQDQQYKGYIDYVDDIDYFKLNVNRASKYVLQVLNMPRSCNLTIINSKQEIISSFKKQGSYNVNLVKDIYLIKFQGIDFKFNSTKNYLFNFQYLAKQRILKLNSALSTNIKVKK